MMKSSLQWCQGATKIKMQDGFQCSGQRCQLCGRATVKHSTHNHSPLPRMPTAEPFHQPLQILLHQESESWGRKRTHDVNVYELLYLSMRSFAETADTLDRNLTLRHVLRHELLLTLLGNLTVGVTVKVSSTPADCLTLSKRHTTRASHDQIATGVDSCLGALLPQTWLPKYGLWHSVQDRFRVGLHPTASCRSEKDHSW